MPELWSGEIVGQMHLFGITNRMLADHFGCTEEYVSMVLHGKKKPKNAQKRFEHAIEEIVKERST